MKTKSTNNNKPNPNQKTQTHNTTRPNQQNHTQTRTRPLYIFMRGVVGGLGESVWGAWLVGGSSCRLIARVSPMYVQSKRCPVGNTKTLARTDTASFRLGVGELSSWLALPNEKRGSRGDLPR